MNHVRTIERLGGWAMAAALVVAAGQLVVPTVDVPRTRADELETASTRLAIVAALRHDVARDEVFDALLGAARAGAGTEPELREALDAAIAARAVERASGARGANVDVALVAAARATVHGRDVPPPPVSRRVVDGLVVGLVAIALVAVVLAQRSRRRERDAVATALGIPAPHAHGGGLARAVARRAVGHSANRPATVRAVAPKAGCGSSTVGPSETPFGRLLEIVAVDETEADRAAIHTSSLAH